MGKKPFCPTLSIEIIYVKQIWKTPEIIPKRKFIELFHWRFHLKFLELLNLLYKMCHAFIDYASTRLKFSRTYFVSVFLCFILKAVAWPVKTFTFHKL